MNVVLGHYPQYTQVALGLGASHFSVPWSIWSGLSDAQRWRWNRLFLDAQVVGPYYGVGSHGEELPPPRDAVAMLVERWDDRRAAVDSDRWKYTCAKERDLWGEFHG